MTIRFAHLADVHLGAFRDDRLRDLNLRAFEEAMDICSQEDLDFVIISGDLFHVNLPEMSVVQKAVQRLRELKESGKRIYLVYGSHDYSAAGPSLIDVLDSAGVFTKVTRAKTEEAGKEGGDDKVGERLFLKFVEDRSGALLCGMSGRRSTLERKYFEMLETGPLEERKGFKIFVFHSAITEFRPDYLPEEGSIPLSLFPKGFDYYAGGHVHERMETEEKGYGQIVFPGTLFGYDYLDLERGSKNPRGLYIVEHDPETGRTKKEFREVSVAGIEVLNVELDGMAPTDANDKLRKACTSLDPSNNVVLLRVKGQLASGRASDIVISEVREGFDQAGAEAVFINRNKLQGADLDRVKVDTGPREEIEEKVFTEYLQNYGSKDPRFVGDDGKSLSRDLLEIFKMPRAEGRTKADHSKILIKKAMPKVKDVPKGGDA